MRYISHQITFQEIPDEISLSFLITGCPLKCAGCHSVDSWNTNAGESLDTGVLNRFLTKYNNGITCVLFLGGEWQQDDLIPLLQLCRKQNLKTALYTGLEDVNSLIKNELTYLKTGSWKKELGGLNSEKTNQKLINLETGKFINFKKTAQGGQNGATYGKSDQQKNGIHQPLSAES